MQPVLASGSAVVGAVSHNQLADLLTDNFPAEAGLLRDLKSLFDKDVLLFNKVVISLTYSNVFRLWGSNEA